MAASEDDRGVDVVEIGDAVGSDDGLDVIEARRRPSGWPVLGAVALVVVGGAIGWLAGHTQREPATVVALTPSPTVTVAATPPPVGCPDNARVVPILPIQSDPLISALRAWFPTFALVDGNRGTGTLGRICGASLTVRDPGGVTVDVTIVSASSSAGDAWSKRPSQVLRLEGAGSNVRAEIVRVTGQGATIDVLVTGPTGQRAPTRAMTNLVNDPRLDLT
jgi:hypothetical protein